jgi:ankyrin repeat protein
MPNSPAQPDSHSVEAVCAAAELGDLEKLTTLLAQHAGWVDVRDQSHEPRAPLHHAASAGRVDAVAGLLSLGANPNIRSGTLVVDGDSMHDWYWEPGWTPLMHAARGGHAEVVRRLLAAGANAGATDRVGFSALHAAIVAGDAEIVADLLARGISLREYSHAQHFDEQLDWHFAGTPLHAAAACGREAAAAALIAAGAPLEECWIDKRTPLFYAAAYGRAGTIRVLANAGANVNAAEDRSVYSYRLTMRPLHYAASNGHSEAVRTLLDARADPTVREAHSKQTPAEMAEQNGHIEIAKIIREHLT